MDLPPLYKYLDVRGAKLTLRNGMFKHSKPSDFNDAEDLTVQSLFPGEIEAMLKELEECFTDIILQRLDDKPTCDSPLREQVAFLQDVYRNNPQAADLARAERRKGSAEAIYDVEHMREVAKRTLGEINQFMQDYRVFCATTQNDSEKMWSTYAQNHKGIVLRIEPNIAKDSKFRLFRPVEYREKRPPLYNSVQDFIAGLFGDQQARRMKILNTIIYSKTLVWQHECEYRLVIPIRQGESSWEVMPYHPEEITELYLGLAMTKEDQEEVVANAKALNPNIKIFRARRNARGKLKFDPV